jgi:transcriptional regulator with XRE-family HTH domain
MGDTKPVKPLEEWIFESGLGQRSFAEKAGVSQTIISQLITGKRLSVKAETAGKIAVALGIEIRQVKEFDEAIKARLAKGDRQPALNRLAGHNTETAIGVAVSVP